MLPVLDDIPANLKRRRPPQPHKDVDKPLTFHDVRTRRFDWSYRERLRKSIEYMLWKENFTLTEILNDKQMRLIDLSTKPQEDGRWLDEKTIMAELGERPSASGFKHYLIDVSRRVYRRANVGSRAIEILKPEPFLYQRMREEGLSSVDELRDLPLTTLRRICPSPNSYNEFAASMQGIEPDYQPPFIDYDAPRKPVEIIPPSES